ncbi:hypothetical protein O3G_MSEX001036 [Manduca sexta]|nr:hypothetical protein O3G_MSEX001036 [Manduca sexta]
MSFKTYSKAIFLLLTVSFVSHAAFKYFRRQKKKEKIKEINEVIMFAHGTRELRRSKYSKCVITPSMERLLYYLNMPKHSIDICMYVFTNTDLTNVVLKLHFKGVKVRLIVDADMAFTSGSSIRRLERQGIPIRWMKSTNLMHHKFCLIDVMEGGKTTPFVMAGSLNWTSQALSGNWENLIITSQKDLVRQYKDEFERLWVLFKPIVGYV